MRLEAVMEIVAKVFAIVGVGVIVVGALHTILGFFGRHVTTSSVYDEARRSFGRPLILGLEVLVAADIIQTITVDLSLESVATLGILVLVRVVLSFSLDIEVDGMPPWRRAQFEATRGQSETGSGS
ncbi:MAG: DUF1622 domain-containing protein [Actinomycetia bacterium]|nr:DUF1622 domain-containing protein [Actinomycetes bacterium]